MRTEVRRALNFQALVIASQGSEAKAIMAYNQAVKEFDTSDDISVEIGRYSALLGVTPLVLTNAYLKCRPAFEKITDDVNILTWEDGGWPKQTRDCPYCPRFLFTKGDVSLLGRMTVAVAGTRNPSQEGKDLCMRTVGALGRKGIVCASGMDVGIEGVSHLASLKEGWPTLAVLGTDVLSAYPEQHAPLQQSIAGQGLLVSRFSPALSLQKWFQILQNRLLCSLSVATVVIEERDGGGAVSQANFAVESGRTVFLFRKTVDNNALLWPRKLADDPGVVVVKEPEEIVRFLMPKKPAVRKKTAVKSADDGQLALF